MLLTEALPRLVGHDERSIDHGQRVVPSVGIDPFDRLVESSRPPRSNDGAVLLDGYDSGLVRQSGPPVGGPREIDPEDTHWPDYLVTDIAAALAQIIFASASTCASSSFGMSSRSRAWACS